MNACAASEELSGMSGYQWQRLEALLRLEKRADMRR